MFIRHSLLQAAALAAASLFTAVATNAQVYTNNASITIPGLGPATPYPSTINVAGAPTSLEYVAVTLNRLTHTYSGDVNVLLVAPGGQSVLLMANAGASGDAVDAELIFTLNSTVLIPGVSSPVVSGVYAPSVYLPTSLPSPAPAGPYSSSLATLIGINPNGNWSLYVWDDTGGDVGLITGGWSITFSSPAARAMTYQGVLNSGGSPLTGAASVRFTLSRDATEDLSTSGLGESVTREFTAIEDGKIVTTLDFGPTVDTLQPLWLNIEVESPPRSGNFVTLTPRQAITPVPQARAAQTAVIAASAVNANSATFAGRAALATNANFAEFAGFADNAQTASFAGNALNAEIVPWAGITGVPANVTNAFGPWAAVPGGINYAGGKVGIGSPTPTYNLEVRSSTSTELALIGGGPAGRTWTLQSTASDFLPGAQLNSSFAIADRTAAAYRLMIDTNGNVGIGTLLPSQRLTVNGNVLANNVAVPSSGRFKHNVLPINDALDKLLKLDGVTFDWNPDFAKDRPGREHDIGFVAEDVAKVFPEVVFYDAEGKVTGMDYSRLTAVAVAAIKQQQVKFDAELAKRDAEAARRDAENAALKARLERLELIMLESNQKK